MPTLLSPITKLACAAAFHLAFTAIARCESPAASLARDFANPPASARPWVWGHWLHGNVDKECITRELEAMKRAGLGGVTMFDVAQPGIPAGPNAYMGESWQQLFAWEISEAKRIGLEVMSQNGPGYSGNGGPWITPEFASQKIVESATRIPGGSRFSGKLPQPESQGGFYRDVAVLAIRETQAQSEHRIEDFDMKRLVWLNYIRWKGTRSAPLDAKAPPEKCIPLEDVINLTGTMQADGSITWNAPAGEWTLLRLGHTWTGQKTLPATPEGEGPECDKLDPRGIRAHFDHVMKRMIELAGPEAGKTFHSFFVDSWEAGGQNWTEKMPGEFQRRRGYDIIPYLPVLTGRVLGDQQTTERFLYDLRQTVSELVTENFWAEMQRLCHAHGMRVAAQTYITTGHDMDAANFSDEPVGEFWSHPFQPNDYRTTVKSAASAANLNGKVIVSAEAFTASETERWLSHPATMKELGDQAFCLGANRFQFHRFAMQRFPQLKPGMTMGKWGQHYDSTQTWWEWSKPWHDYLARCQAMLRIGPVVTDVLAVAPEEPLHRFEHRPVTGYDYDACGPDTFLRLVAHERATRLPDGPEYRLITVNHHGTMTLTRLKKLRDLVNSGANLLGEPPVVTPGLTDLPQADEELLALTNELWGNTGESDRAVGKGRVFRGISPEEALKRLAVKPDFTGPEELTWIHRRSGDTDVYFIATAANEASVSTCIFRVSGKQAEHWDAESGTILPLETVPSGDGRTQAEVPLGPDGSAFIVFRKPAPQSESIKSEAAKTVEPFVPEAREINGPWQVAFPADSGAPKTLQLDPLVSWSVHPDPNVRHFSGTAIYTNQFEISDLKPSISLDLGKVEIMARVKLNGKDLGILWKPPYQVDVSEAVVKGTNHLEISVVNLWVNRLIGDQLLPEDSERDKTGTLIKWPQWAMDEKSSPTGRKSFVTFPLWKKNEPLRTSGLLGPVMLRSTASQTNRFD
ncbi:MAG: glycosyl hydrolase [Luteolibacter sp.]